MLVTKINKKKVKILLKYKYMFAQATNAIKSINFSRKNSAISHQKIPYTFKACQSRAKNQWFLNQPL